jgi:outer membrane protein assembly factor BamA
VTLVYQHNPLQSTALTYDYSVKNLLDLRFGGISVENTDLGGYLPADIVDAVKGLERTSQLILSINRGHLDQISRPRRGIVFKPTLAATTPNAWSDLHFYRGDALLTVFMPVPIGSSALMLRGLAGRLWPTGSSLPEPGDNGEVDFLSLRDQTFTAGGSGDVRGYDTGLLGPKIPRLDDVIEGQPITASNYQPVGGLQRNAVTAELRLPIPGMPPVINAHFFLDGGRVWNSDPRFQFKLLTDDETRWFYSTGGGLGYYSPVGAIRLEGGYILNPSILDLRDPNDVLRAIADGQPVESAPVHQSRRFRVHLSLGLWF